MKHLRVQILTVHVTMKGWSLSPRREQHSVNEVVAVESRGRQPGREGREEVEEAPDVSRSVWELFKLHILDFAAGRQPNVSHLRFQQNAFFFPDGSSFFENCWLLRALSLLRLEEEASL
ncbi:hypothetical protein PAMP_015453 [Pampus punctatissimus]